MTFNHFFMNDLIPVSYETENDMDDDDDAKFREIAYQEDLQQEENEFKNQILQQLEGTKSEPNGLTIFLYVVIIITIILFVFIPLLIIVYCVVIDTVNQIITTVSMLFVAFKRLINGRDIPDYEFGQLLSQICWLFYSRPVVTFLIYVCVKLIGFFFSVIKSQLFDFSYHKEYINKIKKWVVPREYEQKKAKENLLKEVRPEISKVYETLYYILKEENSAKKKQFIAIGIFFAIVIIYIAFIILSIFGVANANTLFIVYTYLYLLLPVIGVIDCILRSWRNAFALIVYSLKNHRKIKEIKEIQRQLKLQNDKYNNELRLFQMGIRLNEPENITEKKRLLQNKLSQKVKQLRTVHIINISALTTWIIEKLYEIRFLEMVYPSQLLGHDSFGIAIQENSCFISGGNFPWVTFIAFLLGMAMKIYLYVKDALIQKTNADSYYPLSIIITIIYILLGPYIIFLSRSCGVTTLKKTSKKKMAEIQRNALIYKDMYCNRIKFSTIKGIDPLKTPWEIFQDHINEKNEKIGFSLDSSIDDNNQNIIKTYPQNNYSKNLAGQVDDYGDEYFNNAEKQFFNADDIEKQSNDIDFDKLLEAHSIYFAAIVVQILYVVVMIIVIICGIYVCTWKTPIEAICYDKINIRPTETIGYYDPPLKNNSFCSVNINNLLITELSALPIIAYFANGEIPLDYRIHNINVILDLAYHRIRTGNTSFNMTELWCTNLEDCEMNNASDVSTYLQVFENNELQYNVLIPYGMRDKGDWILVLEMFIQQFPNRFLRETVPLYEFFMDLIGNTVSRASITLQQMSGVRSVTIKHALRIKEMAEKLPTNQNIAIGQTIGGYFAKYIGYMLRDNYSSIGLDSLSFKENSLCGDYTAEDDIPTSIINVYATGSLLESSEDTEFNYQHESFDFGVLSFIRPPNATDAFCFSVAECSTNQMHINFCETIQGHETFEKTMLLFKRKWHTLS